MKIYTKTGDKGQTGLYRGGRVSKGSARVNAYGSVDELNSFIGWALSQNPTPEITAWLRQAQNELFVIGTDLATPAEAVKPGDSVTRLPDEAQRFMETAIDTMEARLQPLKRFILPGGSPAAAALHVARSVCRRAEREVVTLMGLEAINLAVIIYLNRLSDMLFVMARFQNQIDGIGDTIWEV